MLKVEKIARGKEISIALRRKESFFNTTFNQALAWAFTFHIGAILFFHIAPFSLVSGRIYPPAFVESDLFDGGAIATIDQEGPPKRYLLEPKESRPEIPSIPRLAMMQHLENIQKNQVEDHPFSDVETEFWAAKLFKPHGKNHFFPIEIQFSGLLAEHSFTLTEPLPIIFESFKAIYTIQVDNSTGTVFWYEAKAVPENKRIIVENLIRSLRFDLEETGFITSGEIEITFNQRRLI